MGVKVSVLIPTYNSGSMIDDAIASLDAQSMPPGEFEAVVVDDGSSDGTFAHLTELAASRPWLRVEQIPNSGWPGRPRNIATSRARGDYVLYLDHDDELFPEALERMYRFASEHKADLLLGKEFKSSGPSPAWSTFGQNEPRVKIVDAHVLHSMTPHKMYRREFLNRHDIRFPEGRVRLEDHRFNAQVLSNTDAVAILSDYPCYRWVIHEDNSLKQSVDQGEYWRSLRAVLDDVYRLCTDEGKLDRMLARWYRYLVLDRLMRPNTPSNAFQRQHIEQIAPYFPQSVDQWLAPRYRLLSHLLRRRDWARYDAVARIERTMRTRQPPASIRWHDGALVVSGSLSLSAADGGTFPMAYADGVLRRRLPGVDTTDIPDDLLVVSQVLGEQAILVVRGRRTGIEWAMPTTSTACVEGSGDQALLRIDYSGRIDPALGAFGAPLEPDVWDARVRWNPMGFERLVPVSAAGLREQPALVDGIAAVAYRTRADQLALDLDGTSRTIVGAARVRTADASVDGNAQRFILEVDLPSVHTRGTTELAGTLVLRLRSPATLRGGVHGTHLHSRVDLSAALFEVSTRFGALESAGGLMLRCDQDGVRLFHR